MTTANEILAASPTLRAAFDYTVAFCAEREITDPEIVMAIMERATREIHAELTDFVGAVAAGERPDVVEAVLVRTYVAIRDENGLEVDADTRAKAERYGYRGAA